MPLLAPRRHCGQLHDVMYILTHLTHLAHLTHMTHLTQNCPLPHAFFVPKKKVATPGIAASFSFTMSGACSLSSSGTLNSSVFPTQKSIEKKWHQELKKAYLLSDCVDSRSFLPPTVEATRVVVMREDQGDDSMWRDQERENSIGDRANIGDNAGDRAGMNEVQYWRRRG